VLAYFDTFIILRVHQCITSLKFQRKQRAHKTFTDVVGAQNESKMQSALLRLLDGTNLMDLTADESDKALCYFRLNDAELFAHFQKDTYKDYLQICIEDKYISIHEVMELRQIQKVLGISPEVCKELQNEVSSEVYKKEVDKVIEDGLVEKWEREFLIKLKHDILISPERAEAIFEDKSEQLMREFIDRIVEDQRISPEEEKAFARLCKSLGVKLVMDQSTEEALSIFKLLWQIEFGEIPALRLDFPLNFAEKCFYQTPARYLSMDLAEAEKAGSQEGKLKRYAKGIYATENSEKLPKFALPEERVSAEDNLFLSNQRLWLKAQNNVEFKLEDLMSCRSFANGLGIQIANNWHFFEFENEIGVFSMILNRCLELKEEMMEA
jgi:hypothetical protein